MTTRGDIYFIELGPTVGHEQSGRRPVVVVSCESINRRPLVVTVVPGTDGRKFSQDFPVTVRVPAGESGLPRDTVFLCFQLRAVDQSRFIGPAGERPRRAGQLPPHRMTQIDDALRRVLDL